MRRVKPRPSRVRRLRRLAAWPTARDEPLGTTALPVRSRSRPPAPWPSADGGAAPATSQYYGKRARSCGEHGDRPVVQPNQVGFVSYESRRIERGHAANTSRAIGEARLPDVSNTPSSAAKPNVPAPPVQSDVRHRAMSGCSSAVSMTASISLTGGNKKRARALNECWSRVSVVALADSCPPFAVRHADRGAGW
jgi:hypothetical protein